MRMVNKGVVGINTDPWQGHKDQSLRFLYFYTNLDSCLSRNNYIPKQENVSYI